MATSLFEEMGGRYKRQGDYLIPCITLSDEEEQSIGLWGVTYTISKNTAEVHISIY